GFADSDYAMSGKWLETLKDVSPQVARAVVIFDRQAPASVGFFGSLQAVAPLFGVTLVSGGVQDAADVARILKEFVQGSKDGLIVIPGPRITLYREAIVEAAARHRLPAIYPYRLFPASGGLASYGIDPIDLYRRAAGYIDRVLKGEKPADLPAQAPTKYELVIN